MTVFSPCVAGKGADAEVDLAAFEHHVDAAVLGQPPLADVHRAHDLDAAGHGVQQVLRHFQRLVQAAVDAVADPHAAFRRLDVDVAGPLLHRVENDVVHQADDRRLAGDLLHVADVLDGLLDQRHVGRVRVLDDVVDHEDLGVRQRGDHPPDVFGAGGDDLHLGVGQPADLVDQEQVRRLGDGDRQHAADQKQRQHEVLFDVLARQNVDDLRIEQPGVELGVGHAVFGRQALDHLVLGAVFQLDEDFAQQLLAALLLLPLQRRLQVVGREIALVDQQAAESAGSEGGGVHELECTVVIVAGGSRQGTGVCYGS